MALAEGLLPSPDSLLCPLGSAAGQLKHSFSGSVDESPQPAKGESPRGPFFHRGVGVWGAEGKWGAVRSSAGIIRSAEIY